MINLFKEIFLLRVIEGYRKSISMMWLIYNIGISNLIRWFIGIISKNVFEMKIDFTFHSKKVTLYLDSTLTDIILLTEIFFLNVYQIDYIDPPHLIVDAGSNKGLSAVYFGNIWPNCEIHCYEPNKDLLGILNKNIDANNVNAKIFNYAISDKDGKEYFDVSDNHQYSRLSQQKTSVEVNTIHLESFYKNQRIDILKLDVEGAEEKIIKSLDYHSINCIIGEVHHDLIDVQDFFRRLSEHYHLRKPRLQQYLSNPTVKYPIVTAIRKKQ